MCPLATLQIARAAHLLLLFSLGVPVSCTQRLSLLVVPLLPPFPHFYCTRQAPTLLEMLLRCWVQGKLGAGATPDAGELVSLPRTLIPVVIDKFGAAYTGKSAKWAFATALHAFMTTSWSEATGGCLFFAFPGVVRITGPG